MNAFSEKELYSSSLKFVIVFCLFQYITTLTMFSERSYLESLLKSTGTAVLSGIINFGVSMSITCFEEIGKLKLRIGERKCSQFLVVKIDIFSMTLFTL